MTKFALTPQIAQSYTVGFGAEAISTKLDGGLSRVRKDILNAAAAVHVSWSFNAEEYEYFTAFYRGELDGGALPFTIDLVVDHSALTTYTARFMPGMVQLPKQEGPTYSVSADLEVEVEQIDREEAMTLVSEFNAAHGVA